MSKLRNSMAWAAITQSKDPLDVRLVYALGYALVGMGRAVNDVAVRYAIRRKA